MAEKHTSPTVSSIAARILGSGSIVEDPKFRRSVRRLALTLHVSERACEEIMLPELQRILEPFMVDVRSLAGSALAQDADNEG